MLYTTKGIKLSDKEYHELQFVVLQDDRFRVLDMDMATVQKAKELLDAENEKEEKDNKDEEST